MDKLVEKFLRKIGVEDLTPFSEACFKNLISNHDSNTVIMNMLLPKPLACSCYHNFLSLLKDTDFRLGFSTKISFTYKNKDDLLSLVKDYIDNTENTFEMYDYYISEDDKESRIIFYYNNLNENELKDEVSFFQDFLKEISLNVSVNTILKQETSENPAESLLESTEESSEHEEMEPDFPANDSSNYAEEYETSQEDKEFIASEQEYDDDEEIEEFSRERREQDLAAARERAKKIKEKMEQDKKYFSCSIKDCYQFKKVIIQGKVFKTDSRLSKKGTTIFDVYMTDNTSSILFTIFESKKFDLDFIKTVKEGNKYLVKGSFEYNDFKKSNELRVTDMELLPADEPRVDTAAVKRVELHLHTKMSAMDGVNTITQYCKMAKQFGMDAIAVTDHGVAQAYPEAQKAAKSNGLKMIYGSELYMVDDKPTYIFNPSDDILNDATYVLLDLETTGLSARYDRIIEFGAVKYHKGQVIDEVDFFVNPDIEISEKITKITSITNQQVQGGKPIKKALQSILTFCKDCVLVTHNASFDIGFLNEALKNNGFEEIKNPVIDTLPLSTYFLPDQRSHKLEAVCNAFDVEYSRTEAHRANYDAGVLKDVFVIMIDKLTMKNPKMKHRELQDLYLEDSWKLSRPKHVTCYAKNAQGLKDLFRVISDSNIKYYLRLPLVPRSELEKYRENFILGSACSNGEVFETALNKGEDQLKKVMQFYDFIEVQPVPCYSYLVNEGDVQSEDHIKMILKDLIKAARDIGKTVCATGDVHYLNKEDKIFRDVYIFAKGLKGVRHPLNPFDRERLPEYENPDQAFLSTDEMLKEFEFLNNPELANEIVVTNTRKIADMCEPINPIKDKLYTPTIENCDKNLLDIIYKTAKEMYGDPIPEVIEERLKKELKGITDNNYFVIYYIAHKLVGIANKDGYLVGSRGSVGSSLAATFSKITEVNPLPPHYVCPNCHYLEWVDAVKCRSGYDLPDKVCPHCGHKLHGDGQNIPFATFLGFNAEKVPDIDLNFPSDYQAHAHELTKELLGKDNVFKAGTIETVAEKTAIGYVKGYFEHFGIDTQNVPKAEIERLAMGCQDVKRTTGQHPGGIIVIPNDMSVYDFTPIQYPAEDVTASWKTTHFDFHAIHDNVLKLDLLGHVDPYALRVMQEITGIDVKTVPLNDRNVIEIFNSVRPLKLKDNLLNEINGALGLPEFGTGLGRRILRETKPNSFDDLVRISGLSHGEGVYQGNAQDFIVSGKGTLHDVIGCRDDIMTVLHDVYGIDSAEGFKLMEIVRKGNFMKPEFAQKREYYEKLMREHHVKEDFIESCQKIKYLFPKGHAVAYVMMAVRVAWFKLYHPLAYYAAYYSVRSDAYDLYTIMKGKQAIFKEYNRLLNLKNNSPAKKLETKQEAILAFLTVCVEMEDRGYEFDKMNVNTCEAIMFSINKKTNKIVPPFSAIDGLGQNTALNIVKARGDRPFLTVEDFIQRTRLSDTIINELRRLGAFEGLPESNQINLFEDFFN